MTKEKMSLMVKDGREMKTAVARRLVNESVRINGGQSRAV